jgi:hypothetical protein
MYGRIRSIKVVSGFTVFLLSLAAILVTVGIFDEWLGWDIFSKEFERFLYGVFFSAITLGAFGGAICMVLGIRDSVRAMNRIAARLDRQSQVPDAARRFYVFATLYFVSGLVVLIGLLAFVDQRIQLHRSRVFKRLAAEQINRQDTVLLNELRQLPAPPTDHVPRPIYDVIHTLDNLPFARRTTLYLPDPTDTNAMWGYTAWRDYKAEDGFARFYVARPFEEAMQQACLGQTNALHRINEKPASFTWYQMLHAPSGPALGILRIDANTSENFREYDLF